MSNPRSIKRIGLLTGGGDCPGLNAVIRAVSKTAISSSPTKPSTACERAGGADASSSGVSSSTRWAMWRTRTPSTLRTDGGAPWVRRAPRGGGT